MSGRDPLPGTKEVWGNGAAYERFVGRWSRKIAREFLSWLAVPQGSAWLDVGCGAGALAQSILETCAPRRVDMLDRSFGFVAYAREQARSHGSGAVTADAQALPYANETFDATVSGLALNFIPEPSRAVLDMARITRGGGVVAAYVWDYAGKMEFMQRFWEAAVALNPDASHLDEGRRFSICRPQPLTDLFQSAGLSAVQVRAIDIPTVFRDFDDYWTPFLGGQGSAPTYLMSLSQERQTAMREYLRARLPVAPDGSISFVARAWAVRGTR